MLSKGLSNRRPRRMLPASMPPAIDELRYQSMQAGRCSMKKHNWALFGDNTRSQFSRLWALRTFFFGLLSYDLISITLKHAARYGVDGFNVPHVSWLGLLLPNPTPQVVAVLWTVCAACACLAALNVCTTVTIRLTAAL